MNREDDELLTRFMWFLLCAFRGDDEDWLAELGGAHGEVGLESCLEIGNDGAVVPGRDGDVRPSQPTSHWSEICGFLFTVIESFG